MKFTIDQDNTDFGFRAGGRTYQFEGTTLGVDTEADAKRVRTFAQENPTLGIADSDGPIAAPVTPVRQARPSGEITTAAPKGKPRKFKA